MTPGGRIAERPITLPPAEIRAWVDRHGGNVTSCAARLGVHRTQLQSWLGGKRDLPPAVRAHMESIDRYQRVIGLMQQGGGIYTPLRAISTDHPEIPLTAEQNAIVERIVAGWTNPTF